MISTVHCSVGSTSFIDVYSYKYYSTTIVKLVLYSATTPTFRKDFYLIAYGFRITEAGNV